MKHKNYIFFMYAVFFSFGCWSKTILKHTVNHIVTFGYNLIWPYFHGSIKKFFLRTIGEPVLGNSCHKLATAATNSKTGGNCCQYYSWQQLLLYKLFSAVSLMYDIVVQTILVCNVLRTLEKESVYKKSLLVELNTFELLGRDICRRHCLATTLFCLKKDGL